MVNDDDVDDDDDDDWDELSCRRFFFSLWLLGYDSFM